MQFLDSFVIVFIDDVFVYFKSEDHANHFHVVLGVLEKQRLYAKFSKYEFWLTVGCIFGECSFKIRGNGTSPKD